MVAIGKLSGGGAGGFGLGIRATPCRPNPMLRVSLVGRLRRKTSGGILLCAQTKEGARRLRTRIDHHPFWVHTLDLSQPWRQIHEDWLEMVHETRDTFAQDSMAVASA